MSNEQINEDVEGHLRFSGGLTGPESTEDDVEGHSFRRSVESGETDVEGHSFRRMAESPDEHQDDVEGHAIRVSNPPGRPEDHIPGEGRMRVTDDGQG